MLNREFIEASLLTYTKDLDSYGQTRKTAPVETSIQITKPKLYKHTAVDTIEFQDVTDTCFTYDKSINDTNEIKVGTQIYYIKFANPEGRLSQLFLIKK